MRPQFPAVEQVRQLPLMMQKTVPPDYEDINGHVNIQHYLGMYVEASWPYFARVGMDDAYFTVQRKGIFDLEHHLFYLAEIHVGDTVGIYSRMLGRSSKRIHGIWFIVNETRDQLANTFEFVSACADLDQRRTVPIPDDMAAIFDELIAEQAALDWDAPACGFMAP